MAVNWNGSQLDGDFNNGANWNGGLVPAGSGAAGTAKFTISAATTITDPGMAPLANITASSGATNTAVSVDTDGNVVTLTGSTAVLSFDSAGGAGSSSIELSGIFELTASPGAEVRAAGDSTVTFDGAEVRGTTSNKLRLQGGGDITLAGSTIEDFTRVTVNSSTVRISGDNTVSSAVVLQDGGSLSFASPADSLTANSFGSNSTGGEWVFDLGSSVASGTYIEVGALDLAYTTLNVSNISALVTPNSPVILAEYSSLAGTFAGTTGLLPGQYIDYDFNGLGQVAIVPEPSLLVPILAGFIPLIGFRRRLRRG